MNFNQKTEIAVHRVVADEFCRRAEGVLSHGRLSESGETIELTPSQKIGLKAAMDVVSGAQFYSQSLIAVTHRVAGSEAQDIVMSLHCKVLDSASRSIDKMMPSRFM